MRTISGDIVIPANCPLMTGASVLIEVRDVSRADALSTVVAHMQLTGVNLQPNESIPFSLSVPEVENTRSLDLRIHISLSGIGLIRPGDLLTTASHPLPNQGTPEHMLITVTLI